MSDEEQPNSKSQNKQEREPWWSFVLDVFFWFGDIVAWMIGGVLRVFAWAFAAVLEGCS